MNAIDKAVNAVLHNVTAPQAERRRIEADLRSHLDENGMHIGYKQAFLRRISFYYDTFPIDPLFVLFTEKRQRGFDIIARTVVVKAEI